MAKRIRNEIRLVLSPTYFMGTTNENREYLRMCHYYIRGLDPPQLSLTGLLDLWLEDMLGHALLLDGALDPVESSIKAEVHALQSGFRAYMFKNSAIRRFLQFMPTFPGYARLCAGDCCYRHPVSSPRVQSHRKVYDGFRPHQEHVALSAAPFT